MYPREVNDSVKEKHSFVLSFSLYYAKLLLCDYISSKHQNIHCFPIFLPIVLWNSSQYCIFNITMKRDREREYILFYWFQLTSSLLYLLSSFDALKKLNISLIRSLWNIWIPEGIEFVIVDYWRWDTKIISIYTHTCRV